MEYSKIYGEGQLFSFSGLEGASLYSDDFTGTLTKDEIGIKFYSSSPRILFNNQSPNEATFKIVSSDYIEYEYLNKRHVFLYLKSHVIVGLSSSINVKGKFTESIKDSISYQESLGEVTALYKDNDRFIFVYAKTRKEALKLIEENINFDIDLVIDRKLSFLKNNIENKYTNEMLACKTLSIMKTQIYSKEGVYKSHWSTPDRLPHRKMWLWDSVFHSIGFRNIDTELAKELIEAIFTHQHNDGFIPHMMEPDNESKITQPPVIMYGALKIYDYDKDKEFLKRVYEHNKSFLNWVNNNRRYSSLYLYTWNITNIVTCKCDESGMDNSSRFDTDDKLYAIDFSCFMANETRLMKECASILNIKDDVEYYDSFNKKIVNDINTYLYSKDKHFYFDYNIKKNEMHEVYSVASFLPLFSGVATKESAEDLVHYLNDSSYFNTEFMIPSIAKCDPLFGSDMWRGPVWINYNYMIIDGLSNYGYTELANSIKNKTIGVMNDIYLKTGVIFEFYDSSNLVLPMKLNRKGAPVEPYDFKVKMQTIRDYGWSSTLLFDMLHK